MKIKEKATFYGISSILFKIGYEYSRLKIMKKKTTLFILFWVH
jgi:hypothetical protein